MLHAVHAGPPSGQVVTQGRQQTTGAAAPEKPAGGYPHATAEALSQIAPDPDIPQAIVFVTPAGRDILAETRDFARLPELHGAPALHEAVNAAADRLAAAPRRSVLLLGCGHHMASSLTVYHAAADACRKHGMPLLLETSKEFFETVAEMKKLFLKDPELRRLLGHHAIESREGQKIVWGFVRNSGDRGLFQKLLPEILAGMDLERSGLQPHFVDPIGIHGADEAARERAMLDGTAEVVARHGKAILIASTLPAAELLGRFAGAGIAASGVAVFDETGNLPGRLYDTDPGDNNASYEAAREYREIVGHAPPNADAYRVCHTFDPFC